MQDIQDGKLFSAESSLGFIAQEEDDDYIAKFGL